MFSGPHPETGEELEVVDDPPEGVPAHDLPSQPAVFAPDYAPEEIAEIAAKLRKQAGLPKEPTGEVANGSGRSSSLEEAGREEAASSRQVAVALSDRRRRGPHALGAPPVTRATLLRWQSGSTRTTSPSS